MAARDSYGNTWADQWDFDDDYNGGGRMHEHHDQKKEGKSLSKKCSQKFGEGLNKTKDAASIGMDKTKTAATKGMKKVKEGASVGIVTRHWKYFHHPEGIDFIRELKKSNYKAKFSSLSQN
ncbi:hypothetical protein Ancab_020577 [Ancistrocladus abbreviatus]